jgi:EmrB/QacA subfamily drug resistance transporter
VDRSGNDSRLPPGFAKLAAILMTGVVAVLFDTTIVNVAIDSLSRDLHASVSAAQWTISAYVLAMGVVVPIAAWASDRLGAKRAWIAALSLFAIGSLLCSVAPNIGMLIGFRVIQGIGGGLMLPIMQTVLIRAAGGRPSTRMMATVAVPMMLGPILGPVLGGLIVQEWVWRAIFWVNLPLCVVGLILAWRGMEPTTGNRRAAVDVVGLALLSPALAAVLYGLSEAGVHDGFTDPAVVVPLAGGVLLLAGFIAYALRATSPLVDLRLFATRSFTAASAVLFLTGFALYGAMLLLPLYYQQVRQLDILAAGLWLVPQGVGTLVSRTVAARLADRIGPRPVVLCGIVVTAVATVPFAWAGPHTSLIALALVLVVRGAGLGAVTIVVMATAYQDLSPDQIPHATAITRISQQVGSAFGTTVLAMLLQTQLAHHQGITAATAYNRTFWWSVALAALAAVPALALPRSGRAAARPGAISQRAPAATASADRPATASADHHASSTASDV